MKTKIILLFLIVLFSIKNIYAQYPTVDKSKPSNFYSNYENGIIYENNIKGDIMGYKGNLSYALSDRHLISGEIPILYNDNFKEFGVSDMKYSYSYLPYKNYDKFFGTFLTSIEIIAPVGDYEKGLGTGRWLFSPSVTAGLMVNTNFQFFPSLAYQYRSGMISDKHSLDMHGASFKIITPIVLNDEIYVHIIPNLFMCDFNKPDDIVYVQEILVSYFMSKNMNFNMYYNVNFGTDIYLGRFSLKVYF